MSTPTDDPIDFTFADDGDLRRHAPKAKPEDPIEARLQREVETAPFIADAVGLDDDPIVILAEAATMREVSTIAERFVECRMKWEHHAGIVRPFEMSGAVERGEAMHRAIEVRHGSGKVRV
jgi:hypothetical protein